MPRVLRMMRPKRHIPIRAGVGSRNKVLGLTEIGGAPHAHEAPLEQVVRRFVLQGQGLEQHGQVVRVTTDDLQKAIRARHQGGIVDAMRIHLSLSRFMVWYDAPLTSRYSDRRHVPWLVYGSLICSPAPRS